MAEINGIAVSTCATILNNHTASLESVLTKPYFVRTVVNLILNNLMEKENKNADCTYTKFWRELPGSNSDV